MKGLEPGQHGGRTEELGGLSAMIQLRENEGSTTYQLNGKIFKLTNFNNFLNFNISLFYKLSLIYRRLYTKDV